MSIAERGEATQFGAPGGNRSGKRIGDKHVSRNAPEYLAAMRHVYRNDVSKDKTALQKGYRKIWEENPAKFLAMLEKSELSWANVKNKKEAKEGESGGKKTSDIGTEDAIALADKFLRSLGKG